MVFYLPAKHWGKMKGEEAFITAVRGMNIQAGNYMFPGVESAKEMNTHEHRKKYSEGPR